MIYLKLPELNELINMHRAKFAKPVNLRYYQQKCKKKARAELGQAQLKLELGFTSFNICCIEFMTRLS